MPVRKKFSRSVTKAAHESRARVTERAITPVKASRFELATRPIPGKKNGEREKRKLFAISVNESFRAVPGITIKPDSNHTSVSLAVRITSRVSFVTSTSLV